MCNKAFAENGGTLKFFPVSCKNTKMCHQAVDNYSDAFELFPRLLQNSKNM